MDLTDILNTANGIGGTVLNALGKGKQAAPASAPAPAAAAPAASWTKYLPWIAGGGVVLLILVVVLGRK